MKEAIKIKSVKSSNLFKSVILTKLSYDVEKAHGGSIVLESEMNKGTKFKIVITCYRL